MSVALVLLSVCTLLGSTHGEISFASYYANSMVLQSAPYRANVWGYGDGTNIGQEVTININNRIYTTTITENSSDSRGIWNVKLDGTLAGGPYTLEASSQGFVITLSDVMFGDVWVCSGQSNMEHFIQNIDDAQNEIDNSVNFPNVRIFRAGRAESYSPRIDLDNIYLQWTRPNPTTILNYSAVCWLFGRRLAAQLNKPIGLVESCWGGTIIEAWSSPDVLSQCPGSKNTNLRGKNENSVLWNAMIHPLLPMTVKGVIWYQGEGNRKDALKYNCTFPAMIKDWRQKFNAGSGGQTDSQFPFGFVQLAGWREDPTRVVEYPDTRWAQTASQGYVPNAAMEKVFMAVAMDLPDFNSPHGSIHPRFKQQIGRRLAISGLTVAYSENMGRWYGPRPTNFAKTDNQIKITFENGQVDIDFRNGNSTYHVCCSPVGVATCNAESNWEITTASLDGTSVVVVDASVCPANSAAQGVRYGWVESPCLLEQCSLYSTQQENALPAPPFKYEGGFS